MIPTTYLSVLSLPLPTASCSSEHIRSHPEAQLLYQISSTVSSFFTRAEFGMVSARLPSRAGRQGGIPPLNYLSFKSSNKLFVIAQSLPFQKRASPATMRITACQALARNIFSGKRKKSFVFSKKNQVNRNKHLPSPYSAGRSEMPQLWYSPW